MLNGENRMKIKIGWLFVTVLMLTSCGGIRSVRTAKTTAKTKAVTASKVISGTSKDVIHMIEYQKSNQVLDREPEENETFGVGDAMPIYFF